MQHAAPSVLRFSEAESGHKLTWFFCLSLQTWFYSGRHLGEYGGRKLGRLSNNLTRTSLPLDAYNFKTASWKGSKLRVQFRPVYFNKSKLLARLFFFFIESSVLGPKWDSPIAEYTITGMEFLSPSSLCKDTKGLQLKQSVVHNQAQKRHSEEVSLKHLLFSPASRANKWIKCKLNI